MKGVRINIMPQKKPFKIILTNRTLNDLDNIDGYTTLQHGKFQSFVYRNILNKVFVNISENPYIAEKFYDNSDKTRILKHKHHSIIYNIENNTIKVRAIPHNSRMVSRKIPQQIKRATPSRGR